MSEGLSGEIYYAVRVNKSPSRGQCVTQRQGDRTQWGRAGRGEPGSIWLKDRRRTGAKERTRTSGRGRHVSLH